MGIVSSTSNGSRKLNFEDVQWAINNQPSLIISTLDINNQDCLISDTISAIDEVGTINDYLKNKSGSRIIVYGENAADERIVLKYNQLIGLGFTNVLIYPGGLFEWLLLQDIYGKDLFPTDGEEKDLLKYKGKQQLGVLMLE
tara:strand:+ start:286 stop:711 length:426 start_codon:yes stop_codon:yes gene_type:complete